MTAYLRRSSLSSGGLCLSTFNEFGQSQDAESVVWTVSSAHDGKRVSGIRMRAVRRGVGKYYAPWYADHPTGAYEILWEYKMDAFSASQSATERFFVMDLDNPTGPCGHVRGLPPPGGHVFETVNRISGRDLTLRLSGANGTPIDAHGVCWRIECSNGNHITEYQPAVRLSTGEYGVDWRISIGGGQYFVRWQWSEAPGMPLEEALDTFQIINPSCPKQGVVSSGL